MSRVKVRVCTGKRCAACGAEALLAVEDRLTKAQQEKVKVKDVGCLGHCGKKKHGEPPFVEVGDEVVAEATVPRILKALAAEVSRKDAKEEKDD